MQLRFQGLYGTTPGNPKTLKQACSCRALTPHLLCHPVLQVPGGLVSDQVSESVSGCKPEVLARQCGQLGG